MFFEREMANEIIQSAKDYPVVTIMGPRQSGKTTLVRAIFPEYTYINLEDPAVREFANTDPKKFLNGHAKGLILDEIQQVPQLLSYIQVIVDESKQHGKFILTGSHQLALHEAVSQSLAGRTAILNLFPMTINELIAAGYDYNDIDLYLLNGGYPRIYVDNLNPTKAYRNYFQTYIERDVRRLINIKDMQLFQKFVVLCAGRIGSILNKESLGNDLGISNKTIGVWLSILQASFIIFFLPPYFENFGKRITKSAKLYFNDVGLASYLLGIENITQIARDPLRGFLVENLVILDLMKSRLNKGLDPQLYYYRDNHKNEIDVIFKQAQHLIPIEIKAAETFNRNFLTGVNFYKNLVGERMPHGFVVYAGKHEQEINDISILNYKNIAKITNS